MTPPTLVSVIPWSPHPTAAPVLDRTGESLVTAANGTRTCAGGWLLHYDGVEPGQVWRVEVEVAAEGLDPVRDHLRCDAHWGELPPDAARAGIHDYRLLVPEALPDGRVRFSGTVTAPEAAEGLTVRCSLRWAATGRAVWSLPRLIPAEPVRGEPVTVSVVTGTMHSRRRKFESLGDNVAFYRELCEACLEADRPRLIVLPEICLQWQVEGNALERAVTVPGPETEPFSELCRRFGTRLCLPVFERDGDAVYNSAVLIGPDGRVDGRYHKVHLAEAGEDLSGILPGDGFPVFATEVGRLGCNICMDSSACESSRMVGLNGADFLLLPIMGDHRADRWSPGQPFWNEGRWRSIMRTRAMDNQLTMVVARNEAQGSCVIDRKGEILAWNEGDRPWITATVPADDGYRYWYGGCFREVNWLQRRPHVYGAFVAADNRGSLTP